MSVKGEIKTKKVYTPICPECHETMEKTVDEKFNGFTRVEGKCPNCGAELFATLDADGKHVPEVDFWWLPPDEDANKL